MRSNNLSNKINLINLFRELWQEHILWTRSYIVSAVSKLNDLDFVTNRLLRNPTDFANVLKLYYSSEIAKQFEKLLTEQLTITIRLVTNLIDDNTKASNEDRVTWYKNGDEIIHFLAKISPYMSIKKFQTLYYHHLRTTEDAAMYRITERYPQEIINFDVISSEALKMADIMSYSILEQFYSR